MEPSPHPLRRDANVVTDNIKHLFGTYKYPTVTINRINHSLHSLCISSLIIDHSCVAIKAALAASRPPGPPKAPISWIAAGIFYHKACSHWLPMRVGFVHNELFFALPGFSLTVRCGALSSALGLFIFPSVCLGGVEVGRRPLTLAAAENSRDWFVFIDLLWFYL
jgi:hypothetical protein